MQAENKLIMDIPQGLTVSGGVELATLCYNFPKSYLQLISSEN
jgi:hypothetical protein